ncbi:MAG TPA: MFS transporter [Candidatus Thermoplasmatota archaeon]|nr:MFS transporter [Candidatus Thermoplasmatota archaeon]
MPPLRQAMQAGWRTVWILALTSLLADVSGEMMVAVLPLLLVGQGASGLAVGLFGAVSETVGHLTKWLGGRLGDRVRHPRLLVAGGYAGAGAARVGIALAATWWGSMLWRSVDRVGKGLRTAPRDAILSAAVSPQEKGRAFGLHRAADTTGAFVGVLAALALLAFTGLSAARIVLVAAIVGVAATLPLLFLREPKARPRVLTADAPRGRGFGAFVAVSGLFAAGQASVLFFLLRAGGSTREGILGAAAWYLLFNAVYALASYPLGLLSDRRGKPVVLGAGFALTAVAQLFFVPAPTTLTLGTGFVLLGLSFAATDSTGRALAADLAGSKASTDLGVYHAAIGLASLAGAVAGGLLWDSQGPASLFLLASGLAAAAALAWPAVAPRVGMAMVA